ncbi:MAG: ATP-dependent DNA helicase RecG [Planctomycetota bacterium]
MTTEVAPNLDPQEPLTALQGIGPKRALAFQTVLGVHTIAQLLRVMPRRYEGIPEEVALLDLAQHEGATVRVRATVRGSSIFGRGRRSVLQVHLVHGEGKAKALFFNQAYRRKQFEEGKELFLEGKVSLGRGTQLLAPRSVPEDAEEEGLRAIYPEPEGLPRGAIGRAMTAAAPWMEAMEDPLPAKIRKLAGVPALADALTILHWPPAVEEVQAARRRLALGEMLSLEVRRRRARPTEVVKPFLDREDLWQRIFARIPFALNEEQEEVLQTFRADLASGKPLRRLLHGEVGSGKTAVAFALALAVVADGGQIAIMAPTELLARQHIKTFRAWLKGSRLQVVGLLGDDAASERKGSLLALRTGAAGIAIGTHALFQKDVRFQDLRLVIFDEQHRFGVKQKAALLAKGASPHVLTMTATPIPRTMAWAQYGALEPCVLRARAGAGAAITTQVLPQEAWLEEAKRLRPALERGERCFVVVPRIDGEEGLAVWTQRLFQGPWAGLRGAVVHGRLPGAEVEAKVAQFQRGEIQVLCGTTVVEVGIDVPGIEHMLLLGAERLGLASLHQLRGRLARGANSPAGHCRILVGNPDSMERLKALETCADGFTVAALDLRERGPGTLLGTRQHGASGFSAFDPLEDDDLVQLLRRKELRNWLEDQE